MQHFATAIEPRANGSDWNIECFGGLAVIQFFHIAQGNCHSIFFGKFIKRSKDVDLTDCGHKTAVGVAINDVLKFGIARFGEFGIANVVKVLVAHDFYEPGKGILPIATVALLERGEERDADQVFGLGGTGGHAASHSIEFIKFF